jgi:tight adherence protein B
MVSSLKVGAALQTALESALRESRAPLRPQLEEVVGRIRLGEDPRTAFAGLAERVPLETFQLFVTALAVHWDVGGSLTGTLATVGRTIRDRTEISLRLQSLTTQARASVIAVLLTTYFIALLMWRSDPPRMTHFLAADVGQWMAGISIVLQGIGIVWISHLRNVRY